MNSTIPLFPLHTVLFPGGLLELRIFEPRYLDMVGRCMREDAGFGVALIAAGQEAGGPASMVAVGTLARIVDFERRPDGLLGITARGEQRFRILAARRAADGLNIADVQWLPAEPSLPLSPRDQPLLQWLRHSAVAPAGGTEQSGDASWVGMRLAELLPLPNTLRQELLEMSDADARLTRLQQLLPARPRGPERK